MEYYMAEASQDLDELYISIASVARDALGLGLLIVKRSFFVIFFDRFKNDRFVFEKNDRF